MSNALFDPARPGFGFERPGEGETNDWITPLPLVQRLGQFQLDPCECNTQPWPLAPRGFRPCRGEDGLILKWEGRVWCNPPYGGEIGRWAQRMALHRNGVFLIFSRIETEAWAYIWQTADAVLFPHGRIAFYRPDGTRSKSGTAPSALVAYGSQNVAALRSSGIAGALVSNIEFLTGLKGSQL